MGSPHSMFSTIHLVLFLTIWNTSIAVNVTFTKGEYDTSATCPSGWFDMTSVQMGCLYFHHGNSYTWAEAGVYCHDRGANLVEISSYSQLGFIRAFLDALDNQISGRSWWTAGSDFGVEGQWRWIVSSQPVGSFLWYSGQPDDGGKAQCLALHNGAGYLGYDDECSMTLYPICQRL